MACTMQQLTDAVFLWREHDDSRAISRIISPIETILDDLPTIVIKDGAAAALYISGKTPELADGVAIAASAIDDGKAADCLAKLATITSGS